MEEQNATIINFAGRDTVTDPLTDLLRKGARELLQAAVDAERYAFLAEFAERRTAEGRAMKDIAALFNVSLATVKRV